MVTVVMNGLKQVQSLTIDPGWPRWCSSPPNRRDDLPAVASAFTETPWFRTALRSTVPPACCSAGGSSGRCCWWRTWSHAARAGGGLGGRDASASGRCYMLVLVCLSVEPVFLARAVGRAPARGAARATWGRSSPTRSPRRREVATLVGERRGVRRPVHPRCQQQQRRRRAGLRGGAATCVSAGMVLLLRPAQRGPGPRRARSHVRGELAGVARGLAEGAATRPRAPYSVRRPWP